MATQDGKEKTLMKKWPIEIKQEALNVIVRRIKTVEGRTPDSENPLKHYWEIKSGDIIQFVLVDENYKRIPDAEPVEFKVTYIKKYPSAREMLEAEGLQKVLPGFKSVAEGVKLYHSFPGYKERIKKYGIFAFKIEPVIKETEQPRLPGESILDYLDRTEQSDGGSDGIISGWK